jgi:endonuclease YncB( thermonuclease family)
VSYRSKNELNFLYLYKKTMGNLIYKYKLKSIESAPEFSYDGLTTYCKVISVYDGDTITILIKNNGVIYKEKCRLTGIDTPEMRGGTVESKKLALKAKDYVVDKVLNKIVRIKCGKFEKFGRLLGTVYPNGLKKESLNDELIRLGHAYAYDGGTKKK